MDPKYGDDKQGILKTALEFTEVGNAYTVENGSGRYADIEWKDYYEKYQFQGGGLDVRVWERSEHRDIQIWSGYGFEPYRQGEPTREGSPDERLRTLTGLKATLADFGIALPDSLAERLFENQIEREQEMSLTPEGEYSISDSEAARHLFDAEAKAAADLGVEVLKLDHILQGERTREFLEWPLERIYENYAHGKYERLDANWAVEIAVETAREVVDAVDPDLVPEAYRNRFEASRGIVEVGAGESPLSWEDRLTKIVGLAHEGLGITMDGDLVERLRSIEDPQVVRDELMMARAEAGDINTSNRPGYTIEERGQMIDRELARRYEAGLDLMEAKGIRRAELELQREQNEQANFPRFPFIEEALAAGANVDHISVKHNGSDWTVVSFENAGGTYLVTGEDVYVTQSSVREAQASIEADPIRPPGIRDLELAGDIQIEAPAVSFSHVIDSMGPNNRAILERALEGGAVVHRFWGERGVENPDRYAMAMVSFENSPGTYIFWNGEDNAHHTHLDFGATRYALDFGYEIRDLSPVSEIRSEGNQVEARGRGRDYALSM